MICEHTKEEFLNVNMSELQSLNGAGFVLTASCSSCSRQ